MGESDDAARFFDSFAGSFDGFYTGRRSRLTRWLDRRFRRDIIIRFARTFEGFGDLAGKTLLDLGCGTGPYLLEALRRGAAQVTGVDPAPAMLEHARDRLRSAGYDGRFRLIEDAFPLAGLEPHDHVVVMGVMDYMADAVGFLGALRPLTRISAAVSFPSRHWLRTPLRRIRYRLRRCPVYFYDEKAVRRLFERTGYDALDLWKIPGAGLDFHALARP